MNKLTSKERMLIAFRNQKPDMVPVAPDISNMIPARLTGKPFWDIYLYNDPPLWKAYMNALKYFKFDGWSDKGRIEVKEKREYDVETKIISKNDERIVVRTTFKTKEGDLWEEVTYYRDNPPTLTRKRIKNFKEDFKILKYFFPEIMGYDDSDLKIQLKEMGDLGVVSGIVGTPGLHDLIYWFDNGLEGASYAYYDNYDLIKEFVSWQEKRYLKICEMTLDAKPDFILTGGSGMWAMQSEEIFRDLSLPTLKKVTKMCKEAGIVSFVHSCGKQRKLLDILAKETDVDVVNPLEIPPMGDCDLKELKESLGHRFAFMGNLHTTDVMLKGTPHDVEREAKKAIDSAGKNGGFVLSTGDQCGRDTPDENIFTLIRVAREYGKY
jgi:uroporphyrinogen decarboxylase